MRLAPLVLLFFVAFVSANAHAQVRHEPSTTLTADPRTPKYVEELLKLRDALKATPPPVTEKEKADSVDWMLKANPEIRQILVGHHVIVMATEGFAARAAKNNCILYLDLGYEVLRKIWGVDPSARAGRRFFFWPDPGRAGGHNCNGHDLRVAIGKSDWDNADWFERFFHEMTHGFQFAHPSGHLAIGGLFEGWAEFMQAAVCDHLSPLGAPFKDRFAFYSKHFPAAARYEYLPTRLPMEEIVAYDPSSGLWMELLNTTLDASGRPDWSPILKLLQDPFTKPRWVPYHLWPARLAQDCLEAFGERSARDILSLYRLPVDTASLSAAVAQNWGSEKPDPAPRKSVEGWSLLGPVLNPKSLGPEWNTLAAEDLAWRWRETAPQSTVPPLPKDSKYSWRSVKADERGMLVFETDRGAPPSWYYLSTDLPAHLRKQLTLYISSDDDCAVWLDGRIVHYYRGSRACTPEFPDVAYADATGTKGQLVVLVTNHGGTSGFSMAFAEGGLLFEGFRQRFSVHKVEERVGAVNYVASRRFDQAVQPMLTLARKDSASAVRDAATWWFADIPKDGGDYMEAEQAYAYGTIRGGFFGNNLGASGNQCVARYWGSDPVNWLSLPLEVKKEGTQRVRVRYACPTKNSSMRLRVRRGETTYSTSEVLELRTTGPDWNSWGWMDVPVPRLERGIYSVDLFEPRNGVDVDLVGIVSK